MPVNRRRALGLLTMVLGACSTGDDKGGLTTGYSSGTTNTTTAGTTGPTDTDTGTGTDTYGTDGTDGGYGDDGYFDDERSAKDVGLGD